MKAKNVEKDCIAVQRYNCLFDSEDIENWKKWFIAVQKPMDYILAAALILAGILSGIFVMLLHFKVEKGIIVLQHFDKEMQVELFMVQAIVVLSMLLVLCVGNLLVLKKNPRPRLERCLEVHFYQNSFSLFYFYKKHKDKVYIANFTYKNLDFTRLDHNVLLINGQKIQLGDAEPDKMLTVTERCKYRRFHGYLQGIFHFPYDADVKKLIDQIGTFKETEKLSTKSI